MIVLSQAQYGYQRRTLDRMRQDWPHSERAEYSGHHHRTPTTSSELTSRRPNNSTAEEMEIMGEGELHRTAPIDPTQQSNSSGQLVSQ